MTTHYGQSSSAWDALAAGYDEFVTGSHMDLAEEALERAGVRPGMHLLDVACGSGALSIPAARLGVQVTAVDISAAMMNRLTARAALEGLPNLHGRVMDGHALDFADGTFDICGSQFGVVLFPDLARGLSEMARVTRPGGRVVVVAFGPPHTVEFFGYFLGALRAVVPGFTDPPMDPPPLPFQLADPATFRSALTTAGLTDIRIEAVTGQVEYDSGQHMWDWVTNSNPIGAALVADLATEQRASVREMLDGLLRQRSGAVHGAVLRHAVYVGLATR
ncbi:MAG TPA: methyltransferase domain-containing protein [Micromonosporaceae bacterium]